MKFGKHLLRVAGFSNPEWYPFWINYKLLKTLIKDLSVDATSKEDSAIRKNPNEIVFFTHLHAEFKKVSSFFANLKKELKIRHDLIKDGKTIYSHPNFDSVEDKWDKIGKSVYNLHNSLLLLETFAIMNYCAFSKILKKHDKKTGYKTKTSFMINVVNKSNFVKYPDVLTMIRECEELYNQFSQNVSREESRILQKDELLFIDMVHKINLHTSNKNITFVCNEKLSSQKHVTEDKAIATEQTITTAPIVFENLLQDLLTAKRLRSLSVSSIVSNSTRSERENEDNEVKFGNTGSAFGCNVQKHYVSLADCQPSKKQRHN